MIGKIIKKIKKVLLHSDEKVKHLKTKIDCRFEWYGVENKGFYVCPDLINDQSIVYSFGIGEDISFDEVMIETHGCKVIGFDPTPKSIHWLQQQVLPEDFSYYPYGIGPKTEVVNFYLPVNQDFVSGSAQKHSNVTEERTIQVQMKTLSDITNELGHSVIDVLKMDIEGSEYDVIESILNTDVVINQILIEFHDRFYINERVRSIQSVLQLEERGYKIFASSESFEEVSFVRTAIL